MSLYVRSAHAQTNGFDSKKKKSVTVNTSALHARKIDMPSPGSPSARSARSNRSLKINGVNREPHVVLYAQDDRPSFIESKRNNASSRVFVRKDARTASFEYLDELAPLLHMDDAAENFAIQRTKTDNNNKTHVRMQQLYKGIPVHGGEVMVHLNSFGEGEAFNGRYILPTQTIDVKPSIDLQAVITKVKTEIFKGGPVRSLTAAEKQLVEFAEPEVALCIYEDKSLVKSHVLA